MTTQSGKSCLIVLVLERCFKPFKFFGKHASDDIKRNRHRQSDGRGDNGEFDSGPTGFGGEEGAK